QSLEGDLTSQHRRCRRDCRARDRCLPAEPDERLSGLRANDHRIQLADAKDWMKWLTHAPAPSSALRRVRVEQVQLAEVRQEREEPPRGLGLTAPRQGLG